MRRATWPMKPATPSTRNWLPAFARPMGHCLASVCSTVSKRLTFRRFSVRRTARSSGFRRLASSQGQYEAAVRQVHGHLLAGDFYQANLTFGCDVAVAGAPLALYSRLRQSARAGWGGVILHDDRAIISLSPEQFFTLHRGVVEAKPMKGTAPRRSDRSRRPGRSGRTSGRRKAARRKPHDRRPDAQ